MNRLPDRVVEGQLVVALVELRDTVASARICLANSTNSVMISAASKDRPRAGFAR
jgi:hypothetical protein